MYKIAIFLSNRATVTRHETLLQKLNQDDDFQVTLFLTSSLLEEPYADVYNNLRKHFHVVDVPINDYDITFGSLAQSAARIIRQSASVLLGDNYDCAIAIADRWEVLPFAVAVSYTDIPLVHIQAGEDTGNIDQKVRHAVSHLSDLCLCSHALAVQRLKNMGIYGYKSGCPSIDYIKANNINRLDTMNHVLCIFHPHTLELSSLAEQTKTVMDSVHKFCKDKGYMLYWFDPNNDPGANVIKDTTIDVRTVTNLNGILFLQLLAKAKMIVGNSSAAIREASFLGVPAINIGHRQNNRVRAENVLDCNFNRIYETMLKADTFNPKPSHLFGDGNASEKIIKQLKDFLGRKRGRSKGKERIPEKNSCRRGTKKTAKANRKTKTRVLSTAQPGSNTEAGLGR